MPKPSLQTLEVFVAVARFGNFRRAAAGRNVTPSALSHVIRGLEKNLGVRLFHRTSRSVALTEPGQELLGRIAPALDDLGRALDGIGAYRNRPSGRLRLNVPRIVTELVFEPMVGDFLKAYPEIKLEVITTDDLIDIVAEGFDAGIRRDRRLAPGMIAVPIGMPRRFAVVGAPSYFKNQKRPVSPLDLHAHKCIERHFPSGSRYAWEFKKGREVLEIEVSGPLVVDDTHLMARAALDGLGLAFMFESLVAEHLAAGRLIRVLEDWCPPGPRFFLYYSGHHQVPVALRAFVDFLAKHKSMLGSC
jgi:DNA-binding transcriptional LysR family regulator